jgi:hypothetical protein
MRVNGSNSLGTGPAGTGPASETQKVSGSDVTPSPTVASSQAGAGLSATLGKISQALSFFHTEHAARVQALTAHYQSGQYQSDAQATSNAMWEQAFSI